MHVYGCNLSILWSPLKKRTLKNFAIAGFGHPVSKFWLRPYQQYKEGKKRRKETKESTLVMQINKAGAYLDLFKDVS